MPSLAETMMSKTRKKVFLALLIALAVAINAIESSIPNPLPWVRIGLANVITLLVLLIYGFRDALIVTVTRVFLASLVTGGFLGPAFVLSLGGSLASVTAMQIMMETGFFSAIGLSVGGSFIHTLTQFGLLIILVTGDLSILRVAPPFLLLSLPAGTLVGLLVLKSKDTITDFGGRWNASG